jgi:hypothetical protein
MTIRRIILHLHPKHFLRLAFRAIDGLNYSLSLEQKRNSACADPTNYHQSSTINYRGISLLNNYTINMIKKLLLTIALLGSFVVFTSSMLDNNGKAGKTNSPGEQTCVNGCHQSFALNSGPGSISISAAGMTNNQYVPGQAYNMTITVAQTGVGLFGFDCEALLASNNNAGTLTITDAASTRIKQATVNSVVRNNVTHTLNGGSSANSKAFNFTWTAPPAGSGNVTFYFSGVAANASNTNSGDYVYNSNQVFTEACALPAQPSAITGNTNMCEGTSGQYGITPVAGATSYTWTLPTGWYGSSTSENITVTAGATTGDIMVVANNACGASPSMALTVTGNALPTPVITMTPSAVDTLVCNTTWACQWNFNGNAIAGATYNTYVPAQNGDYTVTVTNNNGCAGTSPLFSYTTLGTAQISKSDKISIAPMPASDFISVTIPGVLLNQELSILDIRGTLISKQVINSNVTSIPVSDLSDGIYFAVIGNDGNRLITKFFISR